VISSTFLGYKLRCVQNKVLIVDYVFSLYSVCGASRIIMEGKAGLHLQLKLCKSRDSSVGIALGYRLEDQGSRIRCPVGAGNFSLHHRVQNGSGAHPASYPMGTKGSFPGSKAAGA
jgi:hypothetical protein